MAWQITQHQAALTDVSTVANLTGNLQFKVLLGQWQTHANIKRLTGKTDLKAALYHGWYWMTGFLCVSIFPLCHLNWILSKQYTGYEWVINFCWSNIVLGNGLRRYSAFIQSRHFTMCVTFTHADTESGVKCLAQGHWHKARRGRQDWINGLSTSYAILPQADGLKLCCG